MDVAYDGRQVVGMDLHRRRSVLVRMAKDQVHAVPAKLGIPFTHSDIFGADGGLWLDQLVLPAPYGAEVASLRALIAVLDGQVTALDGQAAAMLADEPGYAALRELPGIGPVLAAVIIT